MGGRHPFSELRSRMSPEAKERAELLATTLRLQMMLAELRREAGVSRKEMAEKLSVQQGSVAKIERRSDMLVSSVRRFVEAVGGELEIVARIKGRAVRIVNFDAPLKGTYVDGSSARSTPNVRAKARPASKRRSGR